MIVALLNVTISDRFEDLPALKQALRYRQSSEPVAFASLPASSAIAAFCLDLPF
jgi:hypothetical protein